MSHWLDPFSAQGDGVRQLSDPAEFAEQEAAYLRAREIEGRIYPDSLLRALPYAPANHPLAEEWAKRADAWERFARYLSLRLAARQDAERQVLDLGCGNGWMSHRLARLGGAEVVGMDVNRRELAQAARVFGSTKQLRFVYGDIFASAIPAASFDFIVLVAALQYFPDLDALCHRLLSLLKPGGEIHILDTPFYDDGSVVGARQRTQAYYRRLGAAEMARFYHHHRLADLQAFHPDILHDPSSLPARLRRRLSRRPASPFPWLRIRR